LSAQPLKSPTGICARKEEGVAIHKLGRCRQGFKADAKEVLKAGLNAHQAYI